jgi:hypothetical protein
MKTKILWISCLLTIGISTGCYIWLTSGFLASPDDAFASIKRPSDSDGGRWAAIAGLAEVTGSTADDAPKSMESARETQAIPDDAQEIAQAIRTKLQSDREEERKFAVSTLAPTLIIEDPVIAAEVVQSITNASTRDDVLRAMLRALVDSRKEQALGWANNLTDEETRTKALIFTCLYIGESDPEKAIAAADHHGLESIDAGVILGITQRWATADWAGAVKWATSRSPGESRDQVMARIAFVRSKNAPVEAAELVAKEIRSDAVRDEAIISVLQQWGQRDMAHAFEWASKFPSGSLRERAMAELDGIRRYQQLGSGEK